MKRDFASLDQGPFDLLVIGGGVYGAWIAYDAALRGMSVALIDRTDWAAETSSRSSKLIHGGLRYLERFEIGLVRKSLKERRRLARLAPHRVHPVRFMLPVYRGDRVGRFRLKAGLVLYDLLAGGNQPVPRHRSFSRSALMESHPFLEADGLRGGFSYGDCGTDDSRTVLEVVSGALESGAACVNHAEAGEWIREGGRIAGAMVTDRESNMATEVRARTVVRAAGPWIARGELGVPVRLTKGVHLVMPALPTGDAFLFTARSDGRVFFLIPWYGRTLLGTTDTDFTGALERVQADDSDVEYLLAAANHYLAVDWSPDSVHASFAGLRTLRKQKGRNPSAVSREWTLERVEENCFVPVGGKFTSARADAAEAVDAVGKYLGTDRRSRPTDELPLPWCPHGDFEIWSRENAAKSAQLGLDEECAVASARRLGSRLGALHAILLERPELTERAVPDLAFCRGELVHAVRNEMARTLEDVVRRRVPLALLSTLDSSARASIVDLLGAELGWSDERRSFEAGSLEPARSG